MPKETETIDRLFLELSQFTQATTGKELALQQEIRRIEYDNEQLKKQIAKLTQK